ncbi:MAG: chemotaxis protein CheW [Myxococcota bacterium]|nr:chemotaxis protein CheW [Myxococcota bacterium]
MEPNLRASHDELRGDSQIELACLDVRGQSFGIDVQQVREIVRAQALVPLPRAPRLVEGVIDLRGAIVPVVDLGRALGGAPIEDIASARIAIVEVEGLVFGLRAGAASDVLAVAASDVQSPPALVAQAGYEAVRAVVRRRGAPPVLVLALEHVLESVYRSGIEERAREAPDEA